MKRPRGIAFLSAIMVLGGGVSAVVALLLAFFTLGGIERGTTLAYVVFLVALPLFVGAGFATWLAWMAYSLWELENAGRKSALILLGAGASVCTAHGLLLATVPLRGIGPFSLRMDTTLTVTAIAAQFIFIAYLFRPHVKLAFIAGAPDRLSPSIFGAAPMQDSNIS